jgi:twinkle protein
MRRGGPLIVLTVGGQMEIVEKAVNPKVLRWFESRGISHETVLRGGIYSGMHLQNGDANKWEVVPDDKGEVIVYPYLWKEKVVNEKYRAAGKKFYQKLNGVKTFWNADILDDPALQDSKNALIITEGENDALAAMEAGFPFVVSVPDGAPPAKQGFIEDFDVGNVKFSYIAFEWASLQKIKRITIATDNDEPGKRLAEELVRRLGRVRCNFITYPPNCKDLNEVLVNLGVDGVKDALSGGVKPYPISGVYTFKELPPEPELEPLGTGWGRLNDFIKPFYPAFMVVTGLAGAGKSTWTNQLVAQMSIDHDIKVAIASFEMRINPFVTDTLFAVHRERRKTREADPVEWINSNFVFIAPEPGDENDNFNIDWLVEKAQAAVIRHGIRILVIDPWNEIEHAVARRENFSDYTGRAIRALKRFGREFDCLVIVVAHPSKKGAEKQPEEITLYDISDSAHFANKADFGVVISRVGNSYETNVMIKKVRYQPLTGVPGTCFLTFSQSKKTFSQ